MRARVSGQTSPNDWVQYGDSGLYVDIKHTGKFDEVPHYISSLYGNAHHWTTSGATSIYHASKTGFRVYVRFAKGGTLTRKKAIDSGWYIKWTAMTT